MTSLTRTSSPKIKSSSRSLSRTFSALLLIKSLLMASVFAENVLCQSEIGWQIQKKPNAASVRPAALSRREYTFRWKNQQHRNNNIVRPAKLELSTSDRKKVGDGGIRKIIKASTSSSDGISDDHHDHGNNFNLTPPSLKIQPRKKELWLPWPLGALRNDFYRFAEEHQKHTISDGSIIANNSANQQQQLRQYYGDDSSYSQQSQGILHQGRDWASKMLRRGGDLLPMPIFHGSNNANRESNELAQPQPQPRYWIKDTTTSMATASATMKKKDKNAKYGGASQNGFTHRGGQQVKNPDGNGQKWHESMIVKYLKLQASVRLRQLGYVGSDFSVHLPPSSPALLLLYMLPSKQDPLRKLVKFTMTGATISWMHSEATKYRRFAPLPSMKKMNVRQPDLPPFLPEEWVDSDDEAKGTLWTDETGMKGDNQKNNESVSSGKSAANNDNDTSSSKRQEQWDPFASFGGTVSSAIRSWSEDFNNGKKEKEKTRRLDAQQQLLELRGSLATQTPGASAGTSGYALVTGASRGIGRALAVELARYGIPLILVARDIAKLKSVATDIETYYKVPCRIIQADLSSPDCAKRIHDATTNAGLKVDILVNNAGVCSQGEMLDGRFDDAMQMIRVNVGSVVQLSQLYGRDMKQRRRGRILFVSSMSAAMPGCPNVAVYAATKAFEKSLAASLGREMERFGVGVTCLLPGAVKDTAFASRSDVEDAVCFHVPGYAKTPELVAGDGIRAMMLGYSEVYPGWHNKLFVKFGVPLLPARVTTLIAEYAWSPLQWGVAPQRHSESGSQTITSEDKVDNPESIAKEVIPIPSQSEPSPSSQSTRRFRKPLRDMPNANVGDTPEKGAQSITSKNEGDPNGETVEIEESQAAESKFTDEKVSEGPAQVKIEVKEKDQGKPPPDQIVMPPTTKKDDSHQMSNLRNTDVSSDLMNNDADKISTQTDSDKPVLKSQAPSSSSPLAIFGFFEKDPPKEFSDNNTSNLAESTITIESVSTPETADSESPSVTVEPPADSNANLEWYPMMGEKDYNFRDRRLDYTVLTLESSQ